MFDEQKTHFSTTLQGTAHTVFRSQTPEGVRQEWYALLVAYNLVRQRMAEAARVRRIPARHLSLVGCLKVIRNALGEVTRTPKHGLPARYRRYLRDLADCPIDRPRRQRACPHGVKVKMSTFKLKARHERSTPKDFEITLLPGTTQVA